MNKKKTAILIPGKALFGATILVGAYAMNSVAQPSVEETSPDSVAQEASAEEPIVDSSKCNDPNDANVRLTFDANGCPTGADPETFQVLYNKFICWESVGSAVDYELWFDPLKGSPLKSNGQGVIRKKIDSEAPAISLADGIEYKYTIEGNSCPGEPGTVAKYLDPRFQVRR